MHLIGVFFIKKNGKSCQKKLILSSILKNTKTAKTSNLIEHSKTTGAPLFYFLP